MMLYAQDIAVLTKLYVQTERARVKGELNRLEFTDETYRESADRLTPRYVRRSKNGRYFQIGDLGRSTIESFIPPFRDNWPVRTMLVLRDTKFFKYLSKKIKPGMRRTQYSVAFYRTRRELLEEYSKDPRTIKLVEAEFRLLWKSLPRPIRTPKCPQCGEKTYYIYLEGGEISTSCLECSRGEVYTPDEFQWKTAYEYWYNELPLSEQDAES